MKLRNLSKYQTMVERVGLNRGCRARYSMVVAGRVDNHIRCGLLYPVHNRIQWRLARAVRGRLTKRGR